jgi:Ribonuclease toxin, BrnT, of type II toxin-antitoxin system
LIEFDDRDADDEPRFNAIGLVDGRMLFVTYTMREAVVRIISARPPKTDWRAFDATSEAERHRASLSDPIVRRRPRRSLPALVALIWRGRPGKLLSDRRK